MISLSDSFSNFWLKLSALNSEFKPFFVSSKISDIGLFSVAIKSKIVSKAIIPSFSGICPFIVNPPDSSPATNMSLPCSLSPRISSPIYLNPTGVCITFRPLFLANKSSCDEVAWLLTISPFNPLLFARWCATSKITSLGVIKFPFSSMIPNLSASPSFANPTFNSALSSLIQSLTSVKFASVGFGPSFFPEITKLLGIPYSFNNLGNTFPPVPFKSS